MSDLIVEAYRQMKTPKFALGHTMSMGEFKDHLRSIPLRDTFGPVEWNEKGEWAAGGDQWHLKAVHPETLEPVDHEPSNLSKPIIIDSHGEVIDGRHRRAEAIGKGMKSIAAWVGVDHVNEANVSTRDAWSIYAHKRAQVGDGSISWVETPDSASIIDINAGKKTRGHHLVRWLANHTGGKSMDAVGVVPEAEGFWDKMEEHGHITGWNDEHWMTHFGFGHR